jgi:hypothetical protein
MDSQEFMGGIIFFSIFSLISAIVMNKLYYHVRRIERIINYDDGYID